MVTTMDGIILAVGYLALAFAGVLYAAWKLKV